MALFSYFCGQTPYILKILILKVAQKWNWMPPLERTRKTGQENGMVCYVLMKTSWDISSWNFVFLLIQHFLQNFNPLYLKKFSSKHNIPYHFLSQSFEFFLEVTFNFTFEELLKLVFLAYKAFDHKNMKIMPFCHQENIFSLVDQFFWTPHTFLYKKTLFW